MLGEYPTRVLLVDEQPTLVWGLSNLIASDYPRMEVVGISFGTRLALELARSQKPDVIMLGNIAGVDMLQFIVDLAGCGGARIIFMDTREDTKLRAQAMKRGASVVISKCMPASTILAAVERLCSARGDPM